MIPHRMHLRGPWTFEWLTTPGDQQSPAGSSDNSQEASADTSPTRSGSLSRDATDGQVGRVKMPAHWHSLFGEQGGTVRFRRRFQCPTNLDPHEHVFIVFDGIGGSARVAVNETELGTIEFDHTTADFEMTQHLRPSNVLTVDVEYNPEDQSAIPGGLWGPVAIEIRSDETPHTEG